MFDVLNPRRNPLTESAETETPAVEVSADLHPRQTQILAYIKRHIADHQYPPTIREIARDCAISSTSVVVYHIKQLAEIGRLERIPAVARGLRLLS